jgi:hypothetical protein
MGTTCGWSPKTPKGKHIILRKIVDMTADKFRHVRRVSSILQFVREQNVRRVPQGFNQD